MTRTPKHTPHPTRRRLRRLRRLLLLPLAGFVLAGASCSSEPECSSVPVTDTRPVGDGLKTIAYALLGGAVVMILGAMIKR